jgi:NAD(P)-dependent dehydrogenase (short-subunit alcohol dehydrogenase family)
MVNETDTVLITGGSRGIGSETAKLLAAYGPKLVLTYNDSRDLAELVAKECKDLGASSVAIEKLDLSAPLSIVQLRAKTFVQRHDPVTVLINNAAIMVEKPFREMSHQEISRQMDVDLVNIMHFSRPFLLARKLHTLVNIGSDLSVGVKEKASVYCAAKHGLLGWTEGLALEETGLHIACALLDSTDTHLHPHPGRPPAEAGEFVVNVVLGRFEILAGSRVDIRNPPPFKLPPQT